MEPLEKNWHKQHSDDRTFGDRLADAVAAGMGSWRFIITQTIIVMVWMILNVIGIVYHWDPFPFVLLNLLFSTQAAYAAPIIMMSQNRQADRDRSQAEADYETNRRAKKEIEELQARLARIEDEKLDQIIKETIEEVVRDTDKDRKREILKDCTDISLFMLKEDVFYRPRILQAFVKMADKIKENEELLTTFTDYEQYNLARFGSENCMDHYGDFRDLPEEERAKLPKHWTDGNVYGR